MHTLLDYASDLHEVSHGSIGDNEDEMQDALADCAGWQNFSCRAADLLKTPSARASGSTSACFGGFLTVSFDDLGLIEPLRRAVRDEGYETPTPIQQKAIPHVLEGRDLLGLAQTGTGKTAAFALPILQRLELAGPSQGGGRPVRVLILTPTRELASQIGDSFAVYGKHLRYRHAVIFGGVSQGPQERVLHAGVDILIATPGRLLDLAQQRVLKMDRLEIFVLDEADRMLDMGFIHDVRRVISLIPPKRQTLFFSATMPPDAADLAAMILKSPAEVAVTPISSTAERIDQFLYFVEKADKRLLLAELLKGTDVTRALVFSRTKHGANRVADYLSDRGIAAQAIHGNKSQNARERALAGFKNGSLRVLVATDIAARGIDIEEISHVINYDLPNIPETYVHRIGRTARAGAAGIAFSFCEAEERPFLVDIERLIKKQVPVVAEHPYRSSLPPPVAGAPLPAAYRGDSRGSQHRGGGGGGRGGHRGGRGGGGGGGRGGPPQRDARVTVESRHAGESRPREAVAAPPRDASVQGRAVQQGPDRRSDNRPAVPATASTGGGSAGMPARPRRRSFGPRPR